MQAQRSLVLCDYINIVIGILHTTYMHGVDTYAASILLDPLVSCARFLWDVEKENGGIARALLFLVTSLTLHLITRHIFA